MQKPIRAVRTQHRTSTGCVTITPAEDVIVVAGDPLAIINSSEDGNQHHHSVEGTTQRVSFTGCQAQGGDSRSFLRHPEMQYGVRDHPKTTFNKLEGEAA